MGIQQENGGLTVSRGLITIAESAIVVQRSFRLNKRSQNQDRGECLTNSRGLICVGA
jgi:hypothetical protein